jgi:ATP-binding cassette subfamily F protein 3
MADTYPRLTQTEIRHMLASFLFTGDDVFKTISTLSGGERGRVSLAKILLSGANLLVLDEPTNHLDIASKEILEDALRRFTGTLLYISHDRYFINRTATRIWELGADGLTEYLGDYDYYLEKKRDAAPSPAAAAPPVSKTDWQKKREADAQIRKEKNRMERLENNIHALEARIKNTKAALHESEAATDPLQAEALYREQIELEHQLAELYDEWTEGQLL